MRLKQTQKGDKIKQKKQTRETVKEELEQIKHKEKKTKQNRRNKMKLLTKELERKLPQLYDTEHIKTEEKIVHIKYFTPDSNWSWYITEYDPNDRIFFGYVVGLSNEWGYISLAELEQTTGPLGLKIERDLHFKPTKFKNIKEIEL